MYFVIEFDDIFCPSKIKQFLTRKLRHKVKGKIYEVYIKSSFLLKEFELKRILKNRKKKFKSGGVSKSKEREQIKP